MDGRTGTGNASKKTDIRTTEAKHLCRAMITHVQEGHATKKKNMFSLNV